MRYPAWALSTLIALSLASPASALTYYSASRFTKAINPGLACSRRPFNIWTRKRYQSYHGTIYPRNAVLPCRRGRPAAIISGKFELFKISGDRMEACKGYVTVMFTNWGRNLRITSKTTGSVRGMYCRDVGRTSTLNFRP